MNNNPRSELEALLRKSLPRRAFRGTISESVRKLLEPYPTIYITIARRKNPHRPLIDESTDLVVEGFPRSGNTFLTSWLTLTNPHLRIASHLHSISHIRFAVRKGIPAVLLLRRPADAIASEFLNRLGRDEPVGISELLSRYKRFYTQAMRYTPELVISTFDCTTNQPQLVAQALRARFDIDLNPDVNMSDEDVLEDVDRLNTLHVGDQNELTVARPSAARTALADRTKQFLAANHRPDLARLQDLHDTLAASPTTVGGKDGPS